MAFAVGMDMIKNKNVVIERFGTASSIVFILANCE